MRCPANRKTCYKHPPRQKHNTSRTTQGGGVRGRKREREREKQVERGGEGVGGREEVGKEGGKEGEVSTRI